MDIKNIAATLQHGKFFQRKTIAFFYFALSVGVFAMLLSVLIAMLTIFAEELAGQSETAVMVVFFFLFGALLGGTMLWEIRKNNRVKKVILLCFEDAILLKARIKRLDLISMEYKPYQVQAEFDIDGQKYYRTSAPGNFLVGYHKIFANYDNKTIDILYSPKYDQVLILKGKYKYTKNQSTCR